MGSLSEPTGMVLVGELTTAQLIGQAGPWTIPTPEPMSKFIINVNQISFAANETFVIQPSILSPTTPVNGRLLDNVNDYMNGYNTASITWPAAAASLLPNILCVAAAAIIANVVIDIGNVPNTFGVRGNDFIPFRSTAITATSLLPAGLSTSGQLFGAFCDATNQTGIRQISGFTFSIVGAGLVDGAANNPIRVYGSK